MMQINLLDLPMLTRFDFPIYIAPAVSESAVECCVRHSERTAYMVFHCRLAGKPGWSFLVQHRRNDVIPNVAHRDRFAFNGRLHFPASVGFDTGFHAPLHALFRAIVA